MSSWVENILNSNGASSDVSHTIEMVGEKGHWIGLHRRDSNGHGEDPLDRLGRIERAMTADEVKATAAWLDRLSDEQFNAVLEALAGG